MMKNFLLSVMAAAMTVVSAGSTHAQAPVYSFETPGPDGFFGLGATVTQEPTIGVTHLENSLKYEIGNGGFVGARTETVIPATLNDPPGVNYVLVDITITDAYAGTFADMGVTIFGHALNAPMPSFGNQVQFADTVSLATLGVGTHLDQRIDLNSSAGPYRFGESFNDIFGPGPNDLTVASAFQFFISKNVTSPLTVYLDNVRLVAIPEPATAMMLGLGAIVVGASLRRRK